jgi:hypothetical protein
VRSAGLITLFFNVDAKALTELDAALFKAIGTLALFPALAFWTSPSAERTRQLSLINLVVVVVLLFFQLYQYEAIPKTLQKVSLIAIMLYLFGVGFKYLP